MRKLRNIGIALAMGAVAAIPLGGSLAGAQDAGDCGEGGVAAAATSENLGGLVGSLLPVASPNAQSCNENTNTIGSPSGGGGGGGVTPVVVTPASAVGGAPRFAG